MKFTVTATRRSGKVVANEPKPMDFFVFEISLLLDMMRKRQIDKFTIEVSRGSPKQKSPEQKMKCNKCGMCNL